MYKLDLPPNCPCSDAREDAVELYRVILGESITDSDLISYAETNDRFKDICRAYGLSFYKTAKGAKMAYQKARSKNKTLGTHLAKMAIQRNHGKLHTQDDDHYTLWLYSNITASDFECLTVRKVEM
jgi:hypothetical protein